MHFSFTCKEKGCTKFQLVSLTATASGCSLLTSSVLEASESAVGRKQLYKNTCYNAECGRSGGSGSKGSGSKKGRKPL